MADLAFVNQHNMVVYLEKSDENAEFHQIVDFLSTCSINYALTVSPTIYASYIEQFWNTATSKTVNSVKQIHAIVDGKAVVISESSVRNDLLFDDEDGITCLTNDDIFENLALMGKTQKHRRAKKVTELPQTSVPLDLGADEVPRNHRGAPAQTRSERVLKQPNEPPLPKGHTSGSGEGRMAHTFELMDIVPPTPHDSPLPGGYTPGSDEGRLKLEELMAMCTKLSKHVLDLEKEKDAQAVEILKLKKRVKKLERQRKSSISHPRKRIYRQVESSNDDLDEEDASKQGGKVTRQRQFSTAGALVSTARPTVSTIGPSTSVAGTLTDSVMSDSDESGITYTEGPPSLDYVPGPEEPEQAPPSPDYVPGPEHADDEIVAEDQPYAEEASPTARSPDYVPETDPEADPEEDDDEDPEEDPIDYPADGGDDGDDEMDIEEDEDDDMDIKADKEDEDDEIDVELLHLYIFPPSAEETEPFETDESAATPPPHPAYRMTARITIPEPLFLLVTVVMSADSAVTYTSVHSEARSWSIPSEDPYEEAARQLLEQAPRSPEYVPDPIELEDHVPVYIPEPEHPEDLVPAEDEAPTPPLPPFFLSPRIRPPRTRAAMAQMRATTPSTYHSLLPSGTPPLLPIPLPAPSTSRRADIPEADTPPRKRLLLTTPRPSCEVGESSVAAAARQPGPTMAHRVDYSLVDTMETRFRDTERRMMTALEMVNMRVSYQVDVRSRESSEFYSRHHDAQKDRAAVRAEIEVLRRERLAYEQESMETRQALARSEAYCRALEARVIVLETEVRRHEWQRQAADDFAVRHIMRTQALE
ncbi:hypothetical protein Tco_0535754 [Tanacetum coccineum]